MCSPGSTSSGSGSGIPLRKSRLIVFAESGLLAGDLAALLSGKFLVERVTGFPGVQLALRQLAMALIVVEGNRLEVPGPMDELIQQAEKSGTRVIILGMEAGKSPAGWAPSVIHLEAIPEPGTLFKVLNDLSPGSRKAEA